MILLIDVDTWMAVSLSALSSSIGRKCFLRSSWKNTEVNEKKHVLSHICHFKCSLQWLVLPAFNFYKIQLIRLRSMINHLRMTRHKWVLISSKRMSKSHFLSIVLALSSVHFLYPINLQKNLKFRISWHFNLVFCHIDFIVL